MSTVTHFDWASGLFEGYIPGRGGKEKHQLVDVCVHADVVAHCWRSRSLPDFFRRGDLDYFVSRRNPHS